MKCGNGEASDFLRLFLVAKSALVRAGNQVKLILVHPFQPCCDICKFMARSLARGF